MNMRPNTESLRRFQLRQRARALSTVERRELEVRRKMPLKIVKKEAEEGKAGPAGILCAVLIALFTLLIAVLLNKANLDPSKIAMGTLMVGLVELAVFAAIVRKVEARNLRTLEHLFLYLPFVLMFVAQVIDASHLGGFFYLIFGILFLLAMLAFWVFVIWAAYKLLVLIGRTTLIILMGQRRFDRTFGPMK